MADAQDDDEREEELSSIEAIFPELNRDPKNPFSASLELPVTPTDPLVVRFSPPSDGAPPTTLPVADPSVEDRRISQNVEQDKHELQHLPPLQLQITLPQGYPADKAPQIRIATNPSWVPSKTIEKLEDFVSEIWEEYGHMQVVYSYIDYLQQAAERGFDLADEHDGVLDLNQDLKIALLDFDISAKRLIFENETFECEICLEPRKGSLCYRLQKCGHVFCIECLQGFYNNAITEGDVANVKCLAPDCGLERAPGERRAKKAAKTLSPSELLHIPLEREMVQRYVDLKRKKKLEADQSTIYCPRQWCQGPARSKKYPKRSLTDLADEESEDEEPEEPEEPQPAAEEAKKAPPNSLADDRLRMCEQCNYAFCRVCLAGWHGEFIRCWPRSNKELTEEEQASYNYIRMHTSPCPTCASPCQKTHGCNHMNCYQCHTHFCYLCSMWLNPNNPYEHFNQEGRPCYQRLWELEDGDDGQGNVRFDGIRGAEAAAIAAARDEEAAVVVEGPQPAPQQAPVLVIPAVEPVVPPMAPQEPLLVAVAEVDLNDFEFDSEDEDEDVWRPQARDEFGEPFERRPAGQPRRGQRRPALGGAAGFRRGPAGMNLGAQRAFHGGGGGQERRELDQMGVENFLHANDIEGEGGWEEEQEDDHIDEADGALQAHDDDAPPQAEQPLPFRIREARRGGRRGR